MNGIVDLSSLLWRAPVALDLPINEKDALSYNREGKIAQNRNDRKTKVHCNTNRLCEIEDAVSEWMELIDSPPPKLEVSLDNFLRQSQQMCFRVLSV